MNEYEKQAQDFLQNTGATLKIEFLKRGKHFEEDEEERNIYTVTLKKGTRKYIFNFGDSIYNTYSQNKQVKPTNYDILSCLNFDYIESFNDFCDSFGYSNDSKKAKKIYKKYEKEQYNLRILFSDAELELLANIC